MRTLVLGGIRSGKSAFAEKLAAKGGAVRYVATAVLDPADADFTERVAAHRVRRPGVWNVVEGDPVAVLAERAPVTLIDDLGTWLTARIDARGAWELPRGTVKPDADDLVAAVAGYRDRLVIVTPEVGLGVLPATRSGRLFADEIGELNQRLAEICDEVVLVVAGLPTRIKPEAFAAGSVGTSAATAAAGSAAGLAAGVSSGAADVSALAASDSAAAAAGSAAAQAVSAAGLAAGVSSGAADVSALAASDSAAAQAVSAAGLAAAASSGAADVSALAASDSAAGQAVSPTAAEAVSQPGAAAALAAGVGSGAADLSAAAESDSGAARAGSSASPFWTTSAAPVFGAVPAPNAQVLAQAKERQLQLTKPPGALGRLEDLGNWVAACQGVCPPKQFERARVVVFAGDHGIARYGVSAFPSEVTVQMVANFLHGGAAINVLAGLAGATVRVADIAVDGDTDPSVSHYKIRRSSGAIDREDALSQAEVEAALAAGRAIADEEVDSGADLLVAGDMGIGNTTPATVLVAGLTDTEPVRAVGRGTGVDDAGWMRKTAAIRDAMWRARPHRKDPVALLRVAGGADFAAMAGYLAQAAARRTPVILDGLIVTAAALVAEMLSPGAKAWWVAGHRSAEPAHELALTKLGLTPLIELNMRLGEGSGAVTALPVLRGAVAALADMATFADAGVSTAEEADAR
ncbi:nicotinate-nucleotide--dimethylbenzimidazole phosphoribosyltransferase [Nocardia stercoris]|uniref:Nicotinate-nucleotide--dimethylbenzimidazole phosphoribosyltransferase n=1 Tax=Nocardia stercoris TaxID=2483361 RepID=A0A3M2KXB0_9NOCA|nr:nicotinate-nucleotide--dimethylbenzimidazole phosphoribosyltransferase [Nocardia stercoris]